MQRLRKYAALTGFMLLVIALAIGSAGCKAQKVNLPVVLFSDFGSDDYRVSQLKGIILSHNPEARLIDASHGVPAFDVPTGAFMLYMAAKEFPGNVVFVAVVDPYTRDNPRYLALKTSNGQIMVIPDNGLLMYIDAAIGIESIHSIDNQEIFDQPIAELSAERLEGTVGALISTGYRLEDLGEAVSDPVKLDIQEAGIESNQLVGTVIFVDNFGNCVTNIDESYAKDFGLSRGDSIQVELPEALIAGHYGTIYSDVPEGEDIVFVNSNLGVVQLSINMGNYAEKYNLKAGDKIGLVKGE